MFVETVIAARKCGRQLMIIAYRVLFVKPGFEICPNQSISPASETIPMGYFVVTVGGVPLVLVVVAVAAA